MTPAWQARIEPRERGSRGTPEEVDARVRAAHDEKLRPARVEAARRISGWHEIVDDLVPRHELARLGVERQDLHPPPGRRLGG